MDGGRRKRRLAEGEEHKMEKFFALIRSTKDVRDRLTKERESNKKSEEDKFKNVWNPTFQREDFIQDYRDSGIRSTRLAGPSNGKEVDINNRESEPVAGDAPPHDEEANGEDKLDLNLSL